MLDCMDDLRKISDLRVPVNWCVMFFKQNLKRQCGLDYIFVSETELTFLLSFKCVGFIVFICCCFFCVCLYWRYPEARAIHRKVIFHSGPTNSGKTYHAIQRYLSAKSGVYCGPLKLLAHEIFEKSNSAVSSSEYHFRTGSSKPFQLICDWMMSFLYVIYQ